MRSSRFPSSFRRLVPRAFALGILWSMLAAPGRGDDERVLATYRQHVTTAELETWRSQLGDDAEPDPEAELRDLVLVRSLAEEARRLGLDRRRSVRLELELEEGRLAVRTLKREVQQSIAVTDGEVEARYRQVEDTAARPRRVRLRNLFKRYPPDASEEDERALREEMETLRQRVLAGEDFGELAAEESDSQTRFRKGLLGNTPAGKLPPALDAIAMAMEPGEVSEILSSADGLTILYCESILPAVERSPEEVKDMVRGQLERQAFKRRWRERESALIAAAEARYRWEVLATDSPSPEAVLVDLAGDHLTVQDVAVLLELKSPAASLTQWPREDLIALVEEYLLARRSRREIQRRPDLLDRELEGRWLWTVRQVLAQRTLLHLVGDRLVPPTAEEIRRRFEAHRDEYRRPAFYGLDVIALPLDPSDEQRSHREGAKLVHRLRTGSMSFEEAARAHSRHESAPNGGRLEPISRWVLPHRFGFDILRAVLRLEPGEVTDLVAAGDFLWILRLYDLQPERVRTYEEARAQVENEIGTARARALQAEVVASWLERLDLGVTP